MGGLLSRDSHVMTPEEWFDVKNDSSEDYDAMHKESAKELREELFEVTDDNGYIFCQKYYIPEELLSIILSFVKPEDLVFNCRRVCKTWCNVIDSEVWRLKFQRINYIVPRVQDLPWFACYWIFTKKTLNRNLIKNGCGQEKLKHWKIVSSGGDRWKVEKGLNQYGSENFPENSDEDPLKFNSCFVTSYSDCIKFQVIDLAAEGATPEFMDIIKPTITVSEWYAGRFDCLSVYKLKVTLLNENKGPLDSTGSNGLFETKVKVGAADGWDWHKVTHVFDNYGPGVRYIKFEHYGRDSQFWKGHYGSKMTGASVILTLPKNFVEAS